MSQPEAFGRYQLLKVLARGGMGEVHLARQAGMQGFEKLVVVKRILPHLAEDEEFIHMFLDEARIAARLNHPNIVQIFDLGQESDYYYLTMEYIHGDDIRRIWKRSTQAGKKIPVPLACRMIADAAAGLDFAHKKHDEKGEPLHIVHRDISPHNILVTFDGGVKVIDFGIARARGRMSHTATGALKGRFEYMSPEHASGLNVDHRSDIFALGVVLHETLSGVRLFKRDSETATLLAVGECKVEAPSKWNPDVPPELDAIVLKSLAAARDDRFQDAGALRLALEDWIVSARQSGSSAHLSAYMQEIYAERLQTEARLGHPVLDETTGSGNSKSGTAEATRASRKLDPAAPAPPARETQSNTEASALTQTGTGGPPRERSRLPLAAALVAVIVGGVALAVVLARPPASVETPRIPEVPVAVAPPPLPVPTLAVPEPPPPAAPVIAAEVTLRFVSEPPAADVMLDGLLIGRTPLDWTTPRSNKTSEVEIRLVGYRPHAQQVVAFETSTVVAKLQKNARIVAPPPPVKKPDSDIMQRR